MSIFAVCIVTTKLVQACLDIKLHLFIHDALSSSEALGDAIRDVNSKFKDRQIASFCVSDAIEPDNKKAMDE